MDLWKREMVKRRTWRSRAWREKSRRIPDTRKNTESGDEEGNRMLETAQNLELFFVNTAFTKPDEHPITYKSGGTRKADRLQDGKERERKRVEV